MFRPVEINLLNVKPLLDHTSLKAFWNMQSYCTPDVREKPLLAPLV